MFKLIFLTILFSIVSSGTLSAQQSGSRLISENPYLNFPQDSHQTAIENISLLAILFPLNPIFLIENKRFYAGITKEFSVGKFPFGRFAAEYSLIFRETRVNHLRLSYNFDIPLVAGDIAAVILSAGGGYFTDFDKKGYFPQLSFGILLPATEIIAVNLYFKTRYTFMDDKSKSDIFDISLGFSAAYYF
ncbi:MAG: hypothetical protein IPM38_03890 [Ignavibacteria bacterium]|nr:hypothetical protein [Ignavibacteria bacterium]